MKHTSIDRRVLVSSLMLAIAIPGARAANSERKESSSATPRICEDPGPYWKEIFDQTSLSPALLEDVVRRRVGLSFPNLESIPAALASQLSGLPVDIAFPAATSLPPSIALLLVTPAESRHHRLLVFNSLREIDPETAAVLGIHSGGLGLDGVAHLNLEAVRRISRCTGVLSLRGLYKTPESHARVLRLRIGPTLLSETNRTASTE